MSAVGSVPVFGPLARVYIFAEEPDSVVHDQLIVAEGTGGFLNLFVVRNADWKIEALGTDLWRADAERMIQKFLREKHHVRRSYSDGMKFDGWLKPYGDY